MRNSATPAIVQTAGRLYGWLLFAYPGPLRRRFGQEMVLVFEDEVRAAWEERGFEGACRIWCCAATELFRVALPMRLETLMIPVIALLASFALLAMFFRLCIDSVR
jgi:hypothetical protein